ncbi:MBL fold metallo-hydrolase [Rhizobium sp. 1399]|uniref:MBL fold metallo-hydrolase n=1 Tax=Rhizobium sp. 1399 TaxID=2817758 RepID=UPI002854A381|nr:MBL fold metallo-hydrolase [Rhizobium sp. 1399]MDR6670224.1 glyoxylase-like metal-dependent hydrolase (beta-lactamase superfamily II) [Rhizobium sp. 1399]
MESPFLTRTAWVRLVLSLSCLLIVLISHDVSAQASDVQRMRIPVGTYWIGGGGGGGEKPPGGSLPLAHGDGPDGTFTLPAFCIDRGRLAPYEKTDLRAFSGNVTVARYQDNKKIDERSLAEAVSGADPWLIVNGIGEDEKYGSAGSLAVTPLDKTYSYSITVAGLALAGTDQDDVDTIAKQWVGRADLQEAAAAFDGLRQVMLESGPEGQSAATVLERLRQDFEWEMFGMAPQGAQMPSAPIDHADTRDALALLPAEAFRLAPTQIDKEQMFDWLRLSTATLPSQQQLDKIAQSLKAVGFDGDWHASEGGATAALLKAYRSGSRQPSMDPNWSAFPALRDTAKSDFDDALRILALSDLGELALTSGRVDIPVLEELQCNRILDANAGLAEETDLIESWEKRLSFATALDVARRDDRLVKVTKIEDKLCFQWIEKGEIKTRIFDKSDIQKGQLAAIGGKLWLVDDDLTDTEDLLAAAGVKVETAQALQVRLAAEAQVKNKNKDDVHIRSIQRSGDKGLDVAILNLSTNGDANVVRLPDGSLMVIDTGLGSDIVQKIKGYLGRNYKKETPPIRLIITHTDQDHLGGLTALLDAKIEIQEVIIGTSVADEQRPERVDHVKAAFDAAGYEVDSRESVIHIKQPDIAPLIDLDKSISDIFGGIEGWKLYLGNETEFSLYHATNATSPNDSGFLVKLTHRGMSVLLTDDLSAITLRAMTTSLGSTVLKAGFLKWPHHLWFPPGLTQARKALADFVQIVSPHTIAFSGVGHKSHNQKRYEDICKFLRGQLTDSVICHWTREEMANLGLEL